MPTPVISRRLPLLLGFLIAIGPVSVDMYLPAFPSIARAFHDIAAPQYSLAAYFVGLACGQMTQGAWSDRHGRRSPLLFGLVVYTLATIGCAVSMNAGMFDVCRVLAAFGGSAAVVIPRAMVRDLADGPAAAKLFSQLILVMGVAPILAPLFGTALIAFLNWRMIFVAAALYGVAALALTWRFLPDTLPPQRRSVIGIGSIVIRYGEIFMERAFLTHALTMSFTLGALFAYLAATPQIFIGRYHWAPAGYAALFGMNAAAYIGFNQLNPGLVARYGIAAVISVGLLVLLPACAALLFFAVEDFGPYPLMLFLLVCELGFGMVPPNAMVGALSRHQAHAGSAAALLGTMQYGMGAAAGLLVGVWADGTARPMAVTMLLCAAAAALAAALRPRLHFSLVET